MSGRYFHMCENIYYRKGAKAMEVLNLVLFGCVFYLALIGIPTICEKRGK